LPPLRPGRLAKYRGGARRPRELALSSRLSRSSRRDEALACRRGTELRRSCRGGTSVDARLPRRGVLGGLRAGQELVRAAQVATVAPGIARRPRRRLHPIGELCRPRFLNCGRLSDRCVMAITLKERIAREANELGFAAVRFASAEPPPGAGAA